MFAKADEETHVNAWGPPSYSADNEVCSKCFANWVERPYTDLIATARWRPTERMSFASYAARLREPTHPLATSAFFTRWLMILDLMHLADCKGVAANVFGGVMFCSLRCEDLGNNQGARLDALNGHMACFYDAHLGSHRLAPIKLSNIMLDGWAELHGPTVKAANTRAVALVFAYLAERFLVGLDQLYVSLRLLTSLLQEFYEIWYAEPLFMSENAIARIRHVCVDFGMHFQLLREYCREKHIFAFNVKPKVHNMQHIPMICEVINPRFIQCYGEESLIGTTTNFWKRSMNGRYNHLVQKSVLAKRYLGLLVTFEP